MYSLANTTHLSMCSYALHCISETNFLQVERWIAALDKLHPSGALMEEIDQIKDAVLIMDYECATEIIRKMLPLAQEAESSL